MSNNKEKLPDVIFTSSGTKMVSTTCYIDTPMIDQSTIDDWAEQGYKHLCDLENEAILKGDKND